jgi:hypothetical protein
MESTAQTTETATQVEEKKEVFFEYTRVEKFTKPYMYGEPGADAYLRTNMFMGHRICDILPWLQDFRTQLITHCTEKVLPFVTSEVVDTLHRVGDGSAKGATKAAARFGEVNLIQLTEVFQHHQLNGVKLGLIWAKRIVLWFLLRSPFPFLEDGQTVRYCNHKRVLGLKKSVFDELEAHIKEVFTTCFPEQTCSFQIDYHKHVKGDVEANEKARYFVITVRPGVSGESLRSHRVDHAQSKKQASPQSTGKTGNHPSRAFARRVVKADEALGAGSA